MAAAGPRTGGCHGKDGYSRMPNIPSLAGQPEFCLMNQLFLMREGVRRIEVMMPLVQDLKDAEINALAEHYSKLVAQASDEPIDQALVKRGAELAGPRIRASPPIVLRRTTEAVDFIRKVALSTPDRAWQDLVQSFEAARDEWSAMEAVVHLELVLEAGGLLIEEATAYAARSGQDRSRAA
jgi:hypothetical protein